MSGPDFLDTNVLVYAFDDTNPEKQRISMHLLRAGVAGKGVISVQVLAEFAATLLHKVTLRSTVDTVVRGLDALAPIRTITPDGELVRRAVEAHTTYGIHFYDGMIVAAAERAGCERLLSEDLNSGQKYFSVIVENPFV